MRRLTELVSMRPSMPTTTTAAPTSTYGVSGRPVEGAGAVETVTLLSRNHVIPSLGARKLRDLSVEDVDRWLATKAEATGAVVMDGIFGTQERRP
ncbi:hypothetical protein [Streptomyces sp. NPDC058145]|uniref:hypothetical protein n=1 Tax=Streptomyces sp. NPDC058145 TaxID=3346356 RepID=UPI0036EF5119